MNCIDYTAVASSCACLLKLQDGAGNIVVINLKDAHYNTSTDGSVVEIVTPTRTVKTTTVNISVSDIETAICNCLA